MSYCVIDGGTLQPHGKYVFKSDAFRRIYSDTRMYRCTRCGLRQVDISKLDNAGLVGYYAHDYRNVAKIGVDTTSGNSPYYRARATALAALVPSGNPLTAFDLGSGYGYNLQALIQRFPSISLYTDELDVTASLRLSARRQSLTDGPYDVILLSHVLEHFTNPVGVVRDAFQNLSPGGTLVIEVPNDVEGIYTINGPDEPHLTFFTESTFRLLLGTAGVSVVDVFGGGPTYRSKTLKNRLKQTVRIAAEHFPLLKTALTKRSNRILSHADLSIRNPKGNVLRAVVRRPAPQ